MSMGRARSVVLVGMEGRLIEVEADIGQTLPAFVLLGLPDAALRESQDRIRSAAKNTGLDLPRRRLTVNLFPASLPKSGSGLDLAILMSAWAADGYVQGTDKVIFLAELGLDGRLRPVKGVLPSVAAAVEAGARTVVVCAENAAEAALVPGVRVLAADHVLPIAHHFCSYKAARALRPSQETVQQLTGGSRSSGRPHIDYGHDLAEVRGQQEARFALEVAAAGGHHLLLMGAPGAGKTMLAERLPSILPPLDEAESMVATAIASISSGATSVTRLQSRRPFEAPHHSATAASILGGGSRIPGPGAATRAHLGVLYLDETPEFPRHVLDSLRQPLETGAITLHRSAGQVTYPARFQLVLAANPCPCGMNVGNGRQCICSVAQRRNYLSRISGPLLDRVDVHVQVDRPQSAALALADSGEPSAAVAKRVQHARQQQAERLSRYGLKLNSEAPLNLLSHQLRLPRRSLHSLDASLDRAQLSLRGYVRVLRLAWTISDLSLKDRPDQDDVDIAMHLRHATARR
ncbi:YifB family Mg chelatase-like AAA ATPase [Nesterenkonia natronophila]|uniref:ATP-binding protein n=1 Tax=Nesterenkonia natronophila TaxID=2174932 RepID=A0A3A4EZU1_9MICC|nr:YifB family Mg chelatase-like AAA ATPase [Nesterenkonia natronophila]RJN31088.1 ATP-binding protein [Nesterenkonia natronophila]